MSQTVDFRQLPWNKLLRELDVSSLSWGERADKPSKRAKTARRSLPLHSTAAKSTPTQIHSIPRRHCSSDSKLTKPTIVKPKQRASTDTSLLVLKPKNQATHPLAHQESVQMSATVSVATVKPNHRNDSDWRMSLITPAESRAYLPTAYPENTSNGNTASCNNTTTMIVANQHSSPKRNDPILASPAKAPSNSALATMDTNADSQTSDPELSDLSDELLINIFKHLRQHQRLALALVSKRWYRLIHDSSLWSQMEIHRRTLHAMASRGAFKVNAVAMLVYNSSFTHTAMPDIGSRHLRSLQLRTCDMPDEMFVALLQRSPLLEELDISQSTMSLEALRMIPELCPQLRTLSCNMTAVDTACLVDILRNCRSLTTLAVSWLVLEEEAYTAIAEHGTHLECLDLSGAKKRLENDVFSTILEQCTKLRVIDISDCYGLNDKAILAIVQHARCLQSISMSRCHNVTIAAVKKLAKLPALKSINVFGCYQDVYPHIEQACSHMQINKQLLSTVSAISYEPKLKANPYPFAQAHQSP